MTELRDDIDAAYEAKRSKASVDYSPGMKTRHCGICEHYADRKCELVAGAIDPSYWCKLFRKRDGS